MFDEFIDKKVILVDWGVILHKAVYSNWKQSFSSQYVMKPEKIMIKMLLASLRHVGVNEKDDVIIALDSPGNWRKDLDAEYKANRKEAREKTGIDWENVFKKSNNLLENIKYSTPFHVVGVPTLEADDIIATAVKKYSDCDVIVITVDSDFDQLFAYKNFKFFSINTKEYKKPIKNPYNVLEKKIQREPADNLISPVDTAKKRKIRKQIVNLINLPVFVEEKANYALDKIKEKCYNVDKLFYGDGDIRTQYDKIWNPGKNYWTSINRNKKKKKNTGTTIQPLF